jgi:hypothetical protein
MSRVLPSAFALAVLAGAFLSPAPPARADGIPTRHAPEPGGYARGAYDRPPRAYAPPRRRPVPYPVGAPVGPAYLAWPEPDEVRLPIYNRP